MKNPNLGFLEGYEEKSLARLKSLVVPISVGLCREGRIQYQRSITCTWEQLVKALSGDGVTAFSALDSSDYATLRDGSWVWSASDKAFAEGTAGKISCLTYDLGPSSNALLRSIELGTTDFSSWAWFMHTLPSHSVSRADVRIVLPLYKPIVFHEALAAQHLFLSVLGPSRMLRQVRKSTNAAPPNRWMSIPGPSDSDGSWSLHNNAMPIFADSLLDRSRDWSKLADRRLSELDSSISVQRICVSP